MNNFYKEPHIVNYSEMDANCKLRIDYLFSELQKITAFHSKEMGCDGEAILKNNNAIWVLGKMKLQIANLPTIFDQLELQTWPTSASTVRFLRDYQVVKDGQPIVTAMSEWCVLDADTHALRRANSICYPFDLEHRQERSGCSDFSRIREEVSEEDFNHSHCVRYTDVDVNKHTNNVAYVRMALNTLQIEEQKAQPIKEIEMYYLSESYYGQTVRVFKKKTDYGYFITGKVEDKIIFDCVIKA